MKKHKKIEKEVRPYTGPALDEKSELVFLQNGNYHDQERYVHQWRLSPEGEELLVSNCRPEVIAAYTEVWSLRPENEVRLMKRRDSTLIKMYVKKYPLCRDAQVLLVQKGTREDILCLVGTKFPLHSDAIKLLPTRSKGLVEAYYSTPKFRAI